MEIRTIIREALIRANIVPRRQAAPDDKVESGLRLLKGLVAYCNKENYLAFTVSEARLRPRQYIHIYGDTDTMGGDNNRYYDTTSQLTDASNYPEAEDVGVTWAMAKDNLSLVYTAEQVALNTYRWLAHDVDPFGVRDQVMVRYCEASHVHIDNVAKLNSLMITNGVGASNAYTKLSFVPVSDFGKVSNNDLVWTWTPLSEGEFVISTKPYVSGGANGFSLAYNRGLKFDIDTDLRIPDSYCELLIVGLTYKLAVEFPRMDDAKRMALKSEFDTMIENVRTPNADSRMVLRDVERIGAFTAHDVLAGRMLY